MKPSDQPLDDLDILLPTDIYLPAEEHTVDPPEDPETDAIAFVSRINEKLRKTTETLTPMGVPRVA